MPTPRFPDGHENPWLSDEATASISARTAEPSTSPDGGSGAPTCPRPWPPSSPWQTSASRRAEHVTAIRFEYGRVEQGLTTRDGGWDRDGINDAHDDIASAEGHGQGKRLPSRRLGRWARDRICARHRAHEGHRRLHRRHLARQLRPRDLTRNGGGDSLENHDEDQVTQTAKAVTVPRPTSTRPAATSSSASPRPSPPRQRQPRRSSTAAASVGPPRTTTIRTTTVMAAKTTAMKIAYGDGYDRAGYGYDDRYRDEIRNRY